MAGSAAAMDGIWAMRIDEFLLARVAEDEAIARAAIAVSSADWVANNSLLMFLDHERSALVLADVDHYSQDPAWFHVERHDPARVLAECEAKRRIIEFHQSWPVLMETPPRVERVEGDDINSMVFRMSRDISWLTTREYVERFGDDPPTSGMMLALAAVYAGHPDFDPAWRL